MLKILTVPNPILHQKSKPVRKIDNEIRRLVEEMATFLKDVKEVKGPKGKAKGIGLSAPQVSKLLKIILVWSKGSRRFLPMINPQITWKSRRTRLGVPQRKNPYEGCLSVPGVWGKVRRHSVVKINYQTPKGQPVIRKFKGLTGVIVQHEVDHLNGILFIDRIKQQGGKIFVKSNEV